VESLLLVGSARVTLELVQTSTALRVLAGRTGATRRQRQPDLDPQLALRAVQRAGNRAHADCLAQSVALAAVLQRGGHEPTLVLGCRRYGARDWGAHAWVEVDGARLDPVSQPEHAELARLRAANDWRIGPGTS